MTYDDLPIIRIPPVPTDAELQAERDAKHAALIAQEHTDGEWDDDADHLPPTATKES